MDMLNVTLIVKAPNQQIEDQIVKCEPSWSIRRLKGYLSEVYPSKPKTEEQKLIYSGQLLPDHLTLKDVLRQLEEQTTHTVHLVCKNVPSNTYMLENPASNGVRRRVAGAEKSDEQNECEYQGYSPEVVEQWNQHMMNYQQYYAVYMQQYWQQAQSSSASSTFTPTQPEQTVNPRNENNNNNMRMDAQGGMMMEEDDDEEGVGERHRDSLYWFYVMSRALVLFSIVYFYSSPVRFFAITCAVILIYIFQTWRRIQQEERSREASRRERQNEEQQEEQEPSQQEEQAPPRPEEQLDPQQQEEVSSQQEEQIPAQQPESSRESDDEDMTEEQREGESLVSNTYTILCTFFTSLLPDVPGDYN